MKRTLLGILAAAVVLTTGCTSNPGSPKPAPTGASSTPTSSSDGTSVLNSMKPCDLLTDSEATGVGLEVPGEAAKDGTAEACDWKFPGNGGVRTGIRTNAGVNDLTLDGDKVSDIKIGKFDAKKVEADNGSKASCSVWISVTPKSSVAVIANLRLTSVNTAAACERALKAANLIAPKLS